MHDRVPQQEMIGFFVGATKKYNAAVLESAKSRNTFVEAE
jgi:hypothetical protein